MLIIIILLYSTLVPFPFLYNSKQEKIMVSIPQYWFDLSEHLNSKQEFHRVLVLPENDFYMMPYDWYYGVDGWPQTFINAPTVKIENVKGYVSFSDYSNLYSQQIYQKIKDGQSVAQLLGEANIGYILQRNDIKAKTEYRDSIESSSSEVINEYLGSQVVQGNLEKEGNFGKLDLYKVPTEYAHPHIYTEGDSPVKISFSKNNYSSYNVNIENLAGPTQLVFSEGFHKDWLVYAGKASDCGDVVSVFPDFNVTECGPDGPIKNSLLNFSSLGKKSFFDDTHEQIKTFANSWTIDPNEIKEKFAAADYSLNPDGSINLKLLIFFKPQSYFFWGLFISSSLVLGLALYVVIRYAMTNKMLKH